MEKKFPPEKIVDILKNSRIFSQFDEAQLIHLLSFSTIDHLEKGTIIIEENQKNEKIYVLMEGAVAVYVDKELILKLRRVGDIIGEMSVMTNSPTTATVIADTHVTLFAISSKDIHDSKHSELNSLWVKIFSDILSDKLSTTNRKLLGYQAASEELDRKKRELYQKTMILQSVMGSMGDGVVVTDEKGNILHVNEAFTAMVGNINIPKSADKWPRAVGLFKSDGNTLYSVSELTAENNTKSKNRDSTETSREICVKNRQLQDEIWLHAGSSILKMTDGTNLGGAVIVFRDYTRNKHEELALIKAKENAEETARAKTNFLSVMSHELRTPLNAILGMSEILKNSSTTAEQSSCIKNITRNSHELLAKIKNMLDFNHLESGDIQLSLQPYSLKALLTELDDKYRIQAESKQIELKMDLFQAESHRYVGDRERVARILENLLDNAIKFSTGGTVHLSVSEGDIPPLTSWGKYRKGEKHTPAMDLENASSRKSGNASSKKNGTPPSTLYFEVSDNGIGLSRGEIEMLFLPFSQADSSYSRKFEGTGLGLAISRKLIELMGGCITVESQPGKGSRFCFSIMQNRTSTVPQPLPSRAPMSSPFTETKGQVKDCKDSPGDLHQEKSSLKILVAEDNKVNQMLIKKIITKMGYTPKIVENGLKAVKICSKEFFDIILMDIQMPEMDGLQASRKILEENVHTCPPAIVALTANISEGIEQECLSAGMTAFLSKPLKIDKLNAILNSIKKRDAAD